MCLTVLCLEFVTRNVLCSLKILYFQ
ncbi:hypothetical protein EYS14_15700 [Alteromonadaceae bacterium M269]|nr:hypothetical protein EYS14_15700 [Alteromonadaceae bacterium M269]